jgi:hypothetical protein
MTDEMEFRPTDDPFVNGIWLFDNDFPPEVCANDDERAGYAEGERYADELDWRYEAEHNYRQEIRL